MKRRHRDRGLAPSAVRHRGVSARSLLFVASSGTLALVLLSAGLARGQGATQWKPPNNPIAVDFTVAGPERTVAFLDEGLAMEIAVDFMMVQHARLGLSAKLPEPGKFQVAQVNPKAEVEVTNVSSEGTRARADVIAKLKAMSPTDIQNRAREVFNEIFNPARKKLEETDKSDRKKMLAYLSDKGVTLPPPKKDQPEGERAMVIRNAYLDARALEEIIPAMREKLEEIAAQKTRWATPKDRFRWKSAKEAELRDDYFGLLWYRVADQYLHDCGLGFDSNIIGYRPKLETRVQAVHLILSGQIGKSQGDAAVVSKALGLSDLEALRDRLNVKLRCRFFLEADPEDPNALWFNGQRVACRASGVAAVRLQGRLDPKNHDRVDWWLLEGYTPGIVTIDVDKNEAFRIDPPFLSEQGARLRIVATGEEPAEYALEFRPTTPTQATQKVVIHESPFPAEAKFPY